MKTITVIEPSDVKYLRANVGPRYWEDSEVNGEEDISYEEQCKGKQPHIPLTVYNDEMAKKRPNESYRWDITIDLNELKVLNWPEGTTALIHYKVCDDGTYYLLDSDKNILMEKNCYVPTFLSYIGEGYGDYVIMSINKNGYLEHFPKHRIEYLIQEIIDTEGF